MHSDMKERIDLDLSQANGVSSPYSFDSSSYLKTPSSKKLGFYDRIARFDKAGWHGKKNYASLVKPVSNGNKDKLRVEVKHTGDYEDIWSHQSKPDVPAKALLTEDADAETKGEHSQSELCPPKIAEGSKIQKSLSKAVVRPIAFKPVTPSSTSTPTVGTSTPTSQYHAHHSSDNSLHSSLHSSNDITDMSKSVQQLHSAGKTVSQTDGDTDKADSGTIASKYERILAEKEAEMIRVRQTMELNESAIIKVQEQRRVEWEKQMGELAEEYHRRLSRHRDQAMRSEEALRQTISWLESENQRLTNEVRHEESEQERRNRAQHQSSHLQKKAAELNERLGQSQQHCQQLKKKISDLDTQNEQLIERLKAGQNDQCHLQDQIRDLDMKLTNRDRGENGQIESLRRELAQKEQRIQHDHELFQTEREKWKDEKLKVLQYQKQLQQTYVQMYRRNSELEKQLCRISSRRNGVVRGSVESYQPLDQRSLASSEIESSPESFC